MANEVMKIFLINIPEWDHKQGYDLCYEVLSDYFKRHNLDVFVLDKNEFDVHPSWLKLKCFDYVDDDFILCWDMDLLPRKKCPSIVPDLDFTKINAAVDTIFYIRGVKALPFAPYHRYNCGLVGFPRSYKPLLERVFLQSKTSKLPSWEQYPLNYEFSKNDYKDVHELDRTWNCIFHVPSTPESFNSSSNVIHYTGNYKWETRYRLIEMHHKSYFI